MKGIDILLKDIDLSHERYICFLYNRFIVLVSFGTAGQELGVGSQAVSVG